ncbi:MAG: SGNH/GDSL hydrolase family protein [Planctomycetes bacterium]|nr:SGNH/GDSL hydrolase family protein [Planctomycetota bacterium]
MQLALRVLVRVVEVVALTCVVLGSGEGLLLLGGFAHPARPDPFESAFADGRVDGYRIHERDARELWKPIGGARLPWSSDVLDAHGFRGAVLAVERTPGVARLAVLGGSAALGRGVGPDETLGAVAARALAAHGVACEALNAGVVGATLVQARERWTNAVRAWRPDVVLLTVGGVEEHAEALGAPDRELVRTGAAAPSAALGPFARLARDSKRGQCARWVSSGFPSHTAEAAAVARPLDPAGASEWPGARRVAVDEARATLRELAASVRDAGARLVVIVLMARPTTVKAAPVLAAYTSAIAEEARALGLDLVDVRAVYTAAFEHGETYADLFAGPTEPAQLGHLRIGQALAELLAPSIEKR